MTWNTVVKYATGKHDGVPNMPDGINESVDLYTQHYAGNHDDELSLKKRKSGYAGMVNKFYDLVTDFYMFGWGTSFHFAPRAAKETFEASIARQEYWVAQKLQIKPSDKCIDLGCGVGGPLRNIARFTGASVLGINNNDYQIAVTNEMCALEGFLPTQAMAVKGDFMKLDNIEDASVDKMYAFEATCHAPDRVGCFKQAYRVLKPGGLLALQEWCVTDKFDNTNPEHLKVKFGIEVGNSLPELTVDSDIIESLKKAGFEVVENVDLGLKSNHNSIPWYSTLQGDWNIKQFHQSKIGTRITHSILWGMELFRLAPKGSTKTHEVLLEARDNLCRAGEMGIMTPIYFVLARKPSDGERA